MQSHLPEPPAGSSPPAGDGGGNSKKTVSLRVFLRPVRQGYLAELLALLFAALMVALDQWTKYLIDMEFELYESRVFLPGILNFHYVDNKGAAFGMLNDHRWIFMSITTVVILIALFLLIFRKLRSLWMVWSMALVIAGGVGNMIDRIWRGYVVDFIDVQFVKFYVFNVADCCVVVGAFMMMGYFIYESILEQRMAAKPTETEPQQDEQPQENPDDL